MTILTTKMSAMKMKLKKQKRGIIRSGQHSKQDNESSRINLSQRHFLRTSKHFKVMLRIKDQQQYHRPKQCQQRHPRNLAAIAATAIPFIISDNSHSKSSLICAKIERLKTSNQSMLSRSFSFLV